MKYDIQQQQQQNKLWWDAEFPACHVLAKTVEKV